MVVDERPAVEQVSNDLGSHPRRAAVCRYGWEAKDVVRVDGTGEVFIRLDPDARALAAACS